MDQLAKVTLKCQINDHNDSIHAICYNQYCKEFRFNCFKCSKSGIHRNHMDDVEQISSLSEFIENINKKTLDLIGNLQSYIQGLVKSFDQLIKGIEDKYYLPKERIMILNLQQLNDYLSSAIQFDEYKQSIVPIITEMTKKLNHQFSNLKEQLKLSQITYQINDSKYSQELFQKGYNLYCGSEFQKSIEQLNLSIQLDPSNSQAIWCKGACLMLLEKYEDALLCLDQAIEINPKHVNSLSNKGKLNQMQIKLLGACLRMLGKYEESLNCLNQALQIEPFNSFSLQTIGQCLEDQKQYDEALIYYQKALKFKSNVLKIKQLIENCKQKMTQ